ncbi:CTP synthase [bacterium]|nr:CTP synthase [bacterium]
MTKDGAETDLDLGHYERFIDQELTQKSSVMSGRVLLKVINDERNGKYNGDDVQIIPHLTRAIQEYIIEAGKGFDVHIVEIGGTVGDYESLSFIEAIRELGVRVGRMNCLYVHLVYLPYLGASQETKTKPAQNSVRELRGLGIQPDILVARSENLANESVKDKLCLFTGVDREAIALLPNADSIYQVPITLEETGIAKVIVKKLKLKVAKPDIKKWREMVKKATANQQKEINLAFIAKYLDNSDTYMSVFEALRSAAMWNDCKINISWINASLFDGKKDISKELEQYDGVLVPGGFGQRGLEGKINAASYAFQNKKPFLGICLGLQMAVIAVARLNGVTNATTFELDPKSKNQVIITMAGQEDKEMTGGTMRLGDYACELDKGSLAYSLYKKSSIVERHRHRGECNPKYVERFNKWGLKASGINPDNKLVEVIEAVDHPFFIASQYHPEFKSRPTKPHPLFNGFIKSMLS